VEGQYPAEPATDGNAAGGEAQPAVASPPPVDAPAVYSPPPVYAQPPQYAPYSAGPPPAKPRRTGMVLLIIGIVLVALIAAGGVAAVVANATLSSTYSAPKAVTDYLAAQKRGDAVFMFNNANFLRGDGSYGQYFDGGGIGAMLAIPQNTDIQDVKVASTTVVDSNTSTVNVTMTWAGHNVVRAYTVHRDLAHVHYNFYNSWRVDIPFASISVILPNQPGSIAVDGLTLPQGAIKDVQVIQGFHKVTMGGTDLYDNASMDADAIDGSASVIFPNTISAAATATAKKTVKEGFTNCKAIQFTCLNKLYNAPNKPGFVYFFTLPGYGDVPYVTYKYTLTRDQTINMKLVVGADPGKVTVSGTCAYTMTIDGSKKYFLKGTWQGTLTVASGGWGYDLLEDCVKSKA
jgi:hypothetical protein